MKFKILIDENLSRKISASLIQFSECVHVSDCSLERADDIQIWNFARDNGYAILTRDIDFYNLSALYGCPPKVMHLVTPKVNQSTSYFSERLMRSLPVISDFLESEVHCYLEIE